MARRHGRCPRGQRLRMSVPHGHWKTTTFIAGLRNSGIVTPYRVDCPVNRDIFEAWVEQALLRKLRLGDIVIMDNLSSHKGPRVRALIESCGASLLRREAARTVDALWSAIGRLIDLITPKECQNMFAAAGYDPD